MKILIPVLNFGKSGGYRVLAKFADELIQLGHNVDFISPETSARPYYPTKAKILWVDKDGQNIESSENKPILNESGFSIFLTLTKGLRKLPKDSYDIIIANHSLTTFAIKIAGFQHKSVYYVQAYEPELHILLGGLKNKILSHLYSFSYKMNLFTIVNASIYLDYKKLKASRILYPGIDFNLFYPNKENPLNKIKREKIILGTIGRMENFKGTRFVVSAFQELKKIYPEIQLHIAFADAKKFSSYEGIYFYQPDGDKELGNFYRSLDYYICAGYTQLGAFHYPVAEAMSCGIPVITTQYYPANEMNAWLIRPKNVQDIISQLRLTKDISLKEKKVEQALTDVKQFEWKTVGKKLNSYLYEFRQSQN